MTARTPVCPTSSPVRPRSAVTDVPAQVTFWPQLTIAEHDSDHLNPMDSDSSDRMASSIRGMLGPARTNPRRPPMALPTFVVPTLATPMHHPTPSHPFMGISSPIQAMSPPQDIFYPHPPQGSTLRNPGPPPQTQYIPRPQFQPPPMPAPILRRVPPPLPPVPQHHHAPPPPPPPLPFLPHLGMLPQLAVYYYQMPPQYEGPKVKDPDVFTGKDPMKLPTFLGQCAMAFLAKSSQFQNDRDHIIFAASYLRDSALAWWLPCMVKDPPDPIT
jgi:hypothetical protein